MTVQDAITQARHNMPSFIKENMMYRWLSELDGRITLELIDPCGSAQKLPVYDENSMNTNMLVPEPYDFLYIDYLEMQIARTNGEPQRFSNAQSAFHEKYEAFKGWWIRTHPRQTPSIRFPTRR